MEASPRESVVSVKKSHKKRQNRVADFETTTDPNDCRVWAWASLNIDNHDDYVWGNTIESFMSFVASRPSNTYFHNLAFDISFVLDWLFHNGYEWVKDNPVPGEFTSLISRMGKYYSVTVVFKTGYRVEFKDSLKKLPMSVAEIAKAFNLPCSKLEIDYDAYRPIGHQLTKEEKEYLKNDVLIVAMALKQQFDEGMKKLTVGSDSLARYKKMCGKSFARRFPIISPEMDAEIRKAYRGGFTYADPRYSKQLISEPGSVYDVNSLYPSVMRYKPIPIGEPYYTPYGPEGRYPLYITSITFTAKLKPNHIPCIQIKRSLSFNPNEYLTEIREPTTISATNIDLELWQKHYDMDIQSYNGTFEFRQAYGLFDEYIDEFMEIKKNSAGGLRTIAKLHLNSLYGKFATNPDITSKRPIMKDGHVALELCDTETRDPVYTAAGVFITAHARSVTIGAAQDNYGAFAYADTDSLHLVGVTEPPCTLNVDDVELGAWKHESTFSRAVYLRAKQYAEEIDGRMDVHIAGMPRVVANTLTFEDMLHGGKFGGKLIPTRVPGGTVLTETYFTLKP